MPGDTQRSDDLFDAVVVIVTSIDFAARDTMICSLSRGEVKGGDVINPFFNWRNLKGVPDTKHSTSNFSL